MRTPEEIYDLEVWVGPTKMSIQNELSSDIAVALLTRANDDPKKLKDVKETVLRIHSVLQQTAKSYSKRVQAAVAEPPRSPNRKPE